LFEKLLEAVSSIRCEGVSEARDLTNKDNVDCEGSSPAIAG